MNQSPILEFHQVTRIHGTGEAAVHALRDVTLAVAPGKLVAVMGPSGSGKTTLLSVAGGLDTPTAGEVRFEGSTLSGLDQAGRAALRRRGIGYVFQELNLIPSLTAAENVALPRELDGIKPARARGEAIAALEEVAASALADRYPEDMSGGQQQRVAIAPRHPRRAPTAAGRRADRSARLTLRRGRVPVRRLQDPWPSHPMSAPPACCSGGVALLRSDRVALNARSRQRR